MEEESKDIPVVCHTQDQTRNTIKEQLVDICFCNCSLRTRCLIMGCLKYIAIVLKIIFISNDRALSYDPYGYHGNGYARVGYASVLKVLVVLDVLMTTLLMVGLLQEKLLYTCLVDGILKEKIKTIFPRIAMLIKSYIQYIVLLCVFRSFWELVDTIIAMVMFGTFTTHYISFLDIFLTLYLALVVECFRRQVVVESYKRELLNKEGLPPYNQQQNESPPKYEA